MLPTGLGTNVREDLGFPVVTGSGAALGSLFWQDRVGISRSFPCLTVATQRQAPESTSSASPETTRTVMGK